MMPTVTDSKSKCNDELSNDDIPLEGNKIKSSIDCNLSAPTSLLGRTLSASAIDYRSAWRTKKKTHLDGARKFQENAIFSSSVGSVDKQSLKRKLSNTSVGTSGDVPEISIESENTRFLPLSTAVNQEGFVTPFQLKKISRPNSPATIANSRASILTRGRVASIRRESDCSTENEAAHEKMIKSSQQVSLGFEDFCLDDKLFEERKRTKSLTEPISVFTNAFLPQSSSPSPTRTGVDTMQKQCYSPSTQQVVRANISYSPIPSPTMPASPYNRMRSMSPIAVRQVSKRRYTASSGNGIGNQSSGSGLDSDNESSSITLSNPKRRCTALLRSVIGSSASPLVRESTSNINLLHYQQQQLERLTNNFDRDSKPVSVTPLSFSSNSSVLPNLGIKKPNSTESSPTMSRLLVDPQLSIECFQSIESRENDDSSPVLCSSFCSGTGYDANSSTFSSRADTPHSEMLENSGAENEASTSLLLPSQSSCSFDCSSLNTIPAIDTKIPPPPTSSSNLFLCNERKSINE